MILTLRGLPQSDSERHSVGVETYQLSFRLLFGLFVPFFWRPHHFFRFNYYCVHRYTFIVILRCNLVKSAYLSRNY